MPEHEHTLSGRAEPPTRRGIALCAAMGLAFWAGCSTPESVSGTLVDGRTGKPIPGELIRAETEQIEWVRLSTATDTSGMYQLTGLNPEAKYQLVPKNPEWQLEGPAVPRADGNLQVWRVPESDGIYRIGESISHLVTNTPIAELLLPDQAALRYPLVMPGEIPTIGGEEAVLFAGEVTEGWRLSRLEATPELGWKEGKKPRSFAAWWVMGASVTAGEKGRFTVTPVSVDVKETKVNLGDRPLRYVDGGGVPPGRYMIHGGDTARGVVVQFGG